MKVYFAPSGIGLGHVGRCFPIAEALERIGVDTVFSTYGQGVAYLKDRGAHIESAPPIGFSVRHDGTVDFRWSLVSPGLRLLPIVLNQLANEIRIIERHEPEVIVADSRVTPIIAGRLLGIPSIVILNQYSIIIPRRRRLLNLAKIVDGFNLTVIGRLWSLADYVAVADFPEPYTLSAVNLRIPSSRLRNLRLVGPVIPVKPESLEGRDTLREKFGVGNDRKIIFAAISGPVGEKKYLIRILLRVLPKFPEEYAIFMSTGTPGGGSEPVRKGNLTLFPWLKERFELIKASDIIISRAGHSTLSQAMYFGKPTIVVPTPSHTEQFGNALKASSIGFAEMLKQEDLNYVSLLECVERLSHSEDRLRRAEKIRSEVSRIDAVDSILKMILDAAERRP